MKKTILVSSFALMLLTAGCNMLPDNVSNSINRVYENEDGTVDYTKTYDTSYNPDNRYDTTYKIDNTYDSSNDMYDEYYNTYETTKNNSYVGEGYDYNDELYWNNENNKTYMVDTVEKKSDY